MPLLRRLLPGAGAALCVWLVGWGVIMPACAQDAPPKVSLLTVLRDALKRNPSNQLQQQQVFASAGAVLQAQGQFDPLYSASVARQRDLRPLRQDELSQLQGAGLLGTEQQTTDATTIQAGVQKTMGNGVSVGASVSTTSTADSASQLSGVPTQSLGRLNFNVRVPLMRNLGRESTAAALHAAEAEYKAAYHDLVQTNAQTTLNATLAYWDYLARQRRLRLASDAEKRANALLDEMDKLVRADQVPRAEMELLNASRAEKAAGRIQAEQAFLEARQTLARSIGLDAQSSLGLGEPADEFPRYEGDDLSERALPATLREAALSTRADLAASRQREAAARLRLGAARNNLKPQVDLNFNLGYITLAEGSDASAFERQSWKRRVGPTFNATLSMQLPHGNAAAEGSLLAQSASYDASTIRVRELEASIASNVAVRIEALRHAASQLAQGAEAVTRYATTLQNERTKRRLGQSTLMDVLNVQDRFENALSRQVQLQQAYAVAIAQLRFELGTLVREEGGSFDVRIGDLIFPKFSL